MQETNFTQGIQASVSTEQLSPNGNNDNDQQIESVEVDIPASSPPPPPSSTFPTLSLAHVLTGTSCFIFGVIVGFRIGVRTSRIGSESKSKK